MARTRFGVEFVKGRVGEVVEDTDTNNLWCEVENTDTADLEQVEHDLLVICPGLQPPDGLDLGGVVRDARGGAIRVAASVQPIQSIQQIQPIQLREPEKLVCK